MACDQSAEQWHVIGVLLPPERGGYLDPMTVREGMVGQRLAGRHRNLSGLPPDMDSFIGDGSMPEAGPSTLSCQYSFYLVRVRMINMHFVNWKSDMRLFLMLGLAVLPSRLKISAYRVLGMRIGRDTRIGFGTLLLCKDVQLNDGARIGCFCLIRAKTLHLGKRSVICNLVRITVHSLVMKSQSTIFSENQISGDQNDQRSRISLGTAAAILPHCFINVVRPVTLGRNVGVGGGSYLFTHGMWLSKLDGFPVSYKPILIEDDVWLPWGCFIMPGVTIGSHTVVGACSVVTKSLPAGVLAAGVPARVVREKSHINLTVEDRAHILGEITADLGAKLGAEVRIERTPDTDIHYIRDEPLLVFHKTATQAMMPVPILNIVLGELDIATAAHMPMWSLADYASSPFHVIPEPAKGWFAQARQVGVRFYPIDED